MKMTEKFRASRRRRFEDKKGIMPPEMLPKILGTFERRPSGLGPSVYGVIQI